MKKQSKHQQGQSTVEYVLLLSVVMLFMIVVIRSTAFKQFMGENSPFFKILRERFVYTYCHGRDGMDPTKCRINYNTPENHPSYSLGGESRFFSGKEAYP